MFRVLWELHYCVSLALSKSCRFKAKYLNLMTHYSLHPRLTQRWFTKSKTADLLFKTTSHFSRTHQSITWLKKHIVCSHWLLASSLSPVACGWQWSTSAIYKRLPQAYHFLTSF